MANCQHSPLQRSSVRAACSEKNVVQRIRQLAAAAAAVTAGAAAAAGKKKSSRVADMGSLQRKEQPPAAIKKVCTNKVYNVQVITVVYMQKERNIGPVGL